uniref:Uncharacterized protein n=1 Tax=Timema cristinae TaxID=61476 RepID=A0A7R9CYJ6_TIMCR|nr:unnamed protein product [Timema cristinae]
MMMKYSLNSTNDGQSKYNMNVLVSRNTFLKGIVVPVPVDDHVETFQMLSDSEIIAGVKQAEAEDSTEEETDHMARADHMAPYISKAPTIVLAGTLLGVGNCTSEAEQEMLKFTTELSGFFNFSSNTALFVRKESESMVPVTVAWYIDVIVTGQDEVGRTDGGSTTVRSIGTGALLLFTMGTHLEAMCPTCRAPKFNSL